MDFHYANQEFNSHFFKGEDTDMMPLLILNPLQVAIL